jgi:RNA polymerase sigma-70 factor (ECF subfamily)
MAVSAPLTRVLLENRALPNPRSSGAVARGTQVNEGTRSDFRAVYGAHADFVWRVVRGMGVDSAVVADAVQDVFIVVHRRLSEFDGRHPLKTWLFAIAQRVASDYRRKQIRQRAHEPFDEQLRDHAPNPSELKERKDQERALHALLDQLDDAKRLVLILADIEELTAPEIAELTGTPLNTVYTRLRRARREFSAALAAQQRRSP